MARTRTRKPRGFEPPVYTFRIRMLESPYAPENAREITRELELAGNQSLAELASAIVRAYGFDEDHLWSFFLSGKRWDDDTEYALDATPLDFGPLTELPGPMTDLFGTPDAARHDAVATLLRDVPYPGKTGKKEFLLVYDYGDSWEFGVKLLRTQAAVEPDATYPRLTAQQGEAPPQYPNWDGDDEDDWGDDAEDWLAALRPDPRLLGAAWQAMVEEERAQAEDLREFRDDDHYAPIARHFKDDPRRQGDVVLDALLAMTRPDATWLDIGAGGGRYALPLALHSRHVMAVEPSDGMRSVLAASLAEHEIANVEIAPVRWPAEAGDLQADFSLAAHVGYDLLEINPFLDAMEAATRERCGYLLMDRAPSNGFTRLWETIHGEPRAPLPALRELLHLLLARGALPNVHIYPRDMPTLPEDELRASARRRLWLSEGSAKDRRLQALLDEALRDGEESFEFPTVAGLVSWEPVRPAGGPPA